MNTFKMTTACSIEVCEVPYYKEDTLFDNSLLTLKELNELIDNTDDTRVNLAEYTNEEEASLTTLVLSKVASDERGNLISVFDAESDHKLDESDLASAETYLKGQLSDGWDENPFPINPVYNLINGSSIQYAGYYYPGDAGSSVKLSEDEYKLH